MDRSHKMKLKSINIVATEIVDEETQEVTEQKIVQVLWKKQLFDEDGNVASESNHRGSYMKEDKERFLSEVEGAETYIAVLGW